MITVQLLNRALGTGVSAPVAVGIASYIGKKGTDGNTVLYGSGAPSDALGADGNFYIDKTASFIYGPKAAGAWPAGASLIGPAGPVAGTDKQVIFNKAGVAAGSANFTFDDATNTLTLGSDVKLTRGAANTLEQRNGANAQTFRAYNYYTDAANNEFGQFGFVSDALTIGTNRAGSGVARPINFRIGNTDRIQLSAAGHVLPLINGVSDLGSASFKFRNAYFLSTLSVGSYFSVDSVNTIFDTNFLFNTDNARSIGTPASFRPLDIFVGRNVVAGGYVKPGSFTVATLPSASTAAAGALATATNLTSLANGTTATGGGAFKGIVKSDGTNWIVLG